MRSYSAYFLNGKPLDGDGLVLIREKFNWFALILPLIWALWYRQWWALAFYLAASFVLQAILYLVGAFPLLQIISELALALVFAYAAPEFRHSSLKGKGYQELGIVTAEGLEQAEEATLRFLAEWEDQKIREQNNPLIWGRYLEKET